MVRFKNLVKRLVIYLDITFTVCMGFLGNPGRALVSLETSKAPCNRAHDYSSVFGRSASASDLRVNEAASSSATSTLPQATLQPGQLPAALAANERLRAGRAA